MLFVDTETTDLDGIIVTIQYGELDGPIHIQYVWDSHVSTTLRLIERICTEGVCCFNLTFDWYHLVKLYNILLHLPPDSPPDPQSAYKVALKRQCHRFLVPRKACDLMLEARKSHLQTLMPRGKQGTIRLRKVPKVAVPYVKEHLTNFNLNPIMFYKGGGVWREEPTPVDDLVDLKLSIQPSGGLKPIMLYLGLTDHVEEWNPPRHDVAWPAAVKPHTAHWRGPGNKYATDDIKYLYLLYHHLSSPSGNSIDDRLAINVANCRFRGFGLNLQRVADLLQQAESFTPPCNVNSSREVLKYLHRHIKSPILRAAIKDTSEETLIKLGEPGENIIHARAINKRIDLFRKLLDSENYHPDFTVIGARSGRMSGGAVDKSPGSINPQGIQHDSDIRSCFVLRDPELSVLCGGDFDAFEPSILSATVRSVRLHNDLSSGKKIYNIFGDQVSPEAPYSARKAAFLAYNYGSQAAKLAEVLAITEDDAEEGLKRLRKMYPEIEQSRAELQNKFCSMRQPQGIGTEVEWHEPAEYAETLFGFKRYFTVENDICKQLFDAARNIIIPVQGTVQRNKDKTQTISGATRSALYAAAFQLQAANMRAAYNHRIQGTGARLCKELQVRVWDMQPEGIHPPEVGTLNIHDEVLSIHKDMQSAQRTRKIVNDLLEEYRPVIPLLGISWRIGINDWSMNKDEE